MSIVSQSEILIEERLEESALVSNPGVELGEPGDNYTVCSLNVRTNYRSLHGGVSHSLAEITVAAALIGVPGENLSATTVEGKLDSPAPLDPAETDRPVARAGVVHPGSSTVVVDVEVRDESFGS